MAYYQKLESVEELKQVEQQFSSSKNRLQGYTFRKSFFIGRCFTQGVIALFMARNGQRPSEGREVCDRQPTLEPLVDQRYIVFVSTCCSKTMIAACFKEASPHPPDLLSKLVSCKLYIISNLFFLRTHNIVFIKQHNRSLQPI